MTLQSNSKGIKTKAPVHIPTGASFKKNITITRKKTIMTTIVDSAAIEAAQTFAELGKPFLTAVEELAQSQSTGMIYQVCGPISTGGKGSIADNLAIFQRAINAIDSMGFSVINQMPYEDAMQRIKVNIEKNPDSDYHDSLLEDFYLPVFTSGYVKVLIFLPGWRQSTGSKWEYLQAKRFGIQTLEFKENWEELLANATKIQDVAFEILPESCTAWEYDNAVQSARSIFMKKLHDYGGLEATAHLREPSLLDQIYIKLARLATLQDKEIRGEMQKIQDSKQSEFQGVINYCIIALMRRGLGATLLQKSHEEITKLYDEKVEEIKSLMLAKNSDYGEAWREMVQMSYVDLSLVKIARVKSIMALKEKTKASEGIDANYHDIVNYCIFALIMIMEGKHIG